MGIALLELSIIKKSASMEEKRRMHAIFVALFLVVAHVAMIFGMLNPDLFSVQQNTEMNHTTEMHRLALHTPETAFWAQKAE